MLRLFSTTFVHYQKQRIISFVQQSATTTYSSLKRIKILNPIQVIGGYNDLGYPPSNNYISKFNKLSITMSASEISANVQVEEGESSKSNIPDTLGDPGALDSLRESYSKVKKKCSNKWLDYANKSCYIYLYRGGGEPSTTLAAFDLDGTIIKPKSNKRIPRSATDWDFFSVWTKVKLQQIVRENRARFVIFTNQNGIGLNLVPLEEVQKRIEMVTKRLDIPCTVFVAIYKDEFRKPRTGMFELFDKSLNDSKPIDYDKSFYCGDAVGYPSHSDADIKFAQKLGLPFLTPEKFLRGVKPKLLAYEGKD